MGSAKSEAKRVKLIEEHRKSRSESLDRRPTVTLDSVDVCEQKEFRARALL